MNVKIVVAVEYPDVPDRYTEDVVNNVYAKVEYAIAHAWERGYLRFGEAQTLAP